MSTHIPTIQVLSKNNYEEQYIVPLPKAIPFPPLKPSSVRVSSKILSLTTNNFTYARIGHLLGWWDVHPLPSSIPAEFSDPQKYGRISAWGYGVVIESNVSGVDVGTQVYGYLPIGTLPVDWEIQLAPNVPGQILEISKQRASLMAVYNRYMIYPPAIGEEAKAKEKQSQGYDSVFQVLFETSYLMNRFVFAWDPEDLVFPSGEMGNISDAARSWTLEDATIGDDTTVLIFAASGKTALAFGYELKHARPAGKTARSLVAIGSDASKTFTEGTGLFDKVLSYDADSKDLGIEFGLDAKSKIVIVEFGSRGGAPDRWAAKLRQSYSNVVQLRVGGEVVPDSPEKTTEKFMMNMQTLGHLKTQVNASGMRTEAMKKLGEKRYFEEFLKEWNTCKEAGVVKGFHLVWEQGMDELAKCWEKLYKGEFGPDEGFLFVLNEAKEGKL